MMMMMLSYFRGPRALFLDLAWFEGINWTNWGVGLNILTYFVDESGKTGPVMPVLCNAAAELGAGSAKKSECGGLSPRLIMVLHFAFKRLHGTLIVRSKTLFHPI
jgi:hypothetical protein